MGPARTPVRASFEGLARPGGNRATEACTEVHAHPRDPLDATWEQFSVVPQKSRADLDRLVESRQEAELGRSPSPGRFRRVALPGSASRLF